MKMLNHGPRLALIAAACSLAACTQEQPVGAEPLAAPSGPVGTPATAARVITPGNYHVCAIPAEEGAHFHNTMKGPHVSLGDKVAIQKIDPNGTTLVCLGDTCPADPMDPAFKGKVLWMIGNDTKLQAVQEFVHTDGGTPVQPVPRHLVQITNEASVPETCNGRHVLTLRFCDWGLDPDGKKAWLCFAPAPHGGAAHLED